MSRTLQLCLVAAVIAGLTAAPAVSEAQVQGPTRAEYVAQADPICKASTRVQAKHFKRAFKGIKPGDFEAAGDTEDPKEIIDAFKKLIKPLGRAFVRGSRGVHVTVDQLAAIPRPPADASTLESWVASLLVGVKLSKRAGQALKHGRLKVGFKRFDTLIRHTEATDAIVAGFGFVDCVPPVDSGTRFAR